MMCDKKELLVAYLYDDVTAEERRAFDAHAAVCAECRDELESLRATRDHLSLWTPPDRDFGFRIVREPAAPLAKVIPFRSRWVPAFGLAAAAVLVLAAASAIANLEVRYDDNGFVVRTGWARGASVTPEGRSASAPPPAAGDAGRISLTGVSTPPSGASRADFDALDRRLRELEAATAAQPSRPLAQTADGRAMSDAEMLRRVREIVRDAEARQQVAVAQRLLQVVQDFDRQRRADVAMLQQGMGQYQGVTNMEIAHTRDIVNQLMRVANRQEK